MKIGSIVECVDFSNPRNSISQTLKPKQPYTVREMHISANGVRGILLEEIINPIHSMETGEYGYRAERFRELLPPMEIQDALDSCEPVLIEITHVKPL